MIIIKLGFEIVPLYTLILILNIKFKRNNKKTANLAESFFSNIY
jgi:hypothetical protein